MTRPAAIASAPSPPLPDRTIDTEYTAHGRLITPGTELSISGAKGRFRFHEHVLTDAGAEWITVYGGPDNQTAFRAFTPDRIKTVHRTRKART